MGFYPTHPHRTPSGLFLPTLIEESSNCLSTWQKQAFLPLLADCVGGKYFLENWVSLPPEKNEKSSIGLTTTVKLAFNNFKATPAIAIPHFWCDSYSVHGNHGNNDL